MWRLNVFCMSVCMSTPGCTLCPLRLGRFILCSLSHSRLPVKGFRGLQFDYSAIAPGKRKMGAWRCNQTVIHGPLTSRRLCDMTAADEATEAWGHKAPPGGNEESLPRQESINSGRKALHQIRRGVAPERRTHEGHESGRNEAL